MPRQDRKSVAIFSGLSMSWLLLVEYPIEGLMSILLMWINYFSWVGGNPCFKRSSVEFSVESEELDYFLNLVNLIGWGSVPFFKRTTISDACELLIGYWETETHSRARNDCYVLTFSSRGITLFIIFHWFFFVIFPQFFQFFQFFFLHWSWILSF